MCDRKSPVEIDRKCMPTASLAKAIHQQKAEGNSLCSVPFRLRPADELELMRKGYRCTAGVGFYTNIEYTD